MFDVYWKDTVRSNQLVTPKMKNPYQIYTDFNERERVERKSK